MTFATIAQTMDNMNAIDIITYTVFALAIIGAYTVVQAAKDAINKFRSSRNNQQVTVDLPAIQTVGKPAVKPVVLPQTAPAPRNRKYIVNTDACQQYLSGRL